MRNLTSEVIILRRLSRLNSQLAINKNSYVVPNFTWFVKYVALKCIKLRCRNNAKKLHLKHILNHLSNET